MALNFLYSIDPNTMLLILLFFIFFAFLNWILFRFFKNRGTSGVISFCISALAVYGLNRTDFDISSWFYGIGLSENFLYTVVPFIILAAIIISIWKLKLHRTLMILGALMIIVSLANLVYQKEVVLIAGIVLLVLGFILWNRQRRKRNIRHADWKTQEDYKQKLKDKSERKRDKSNRGNSDSSSGGSSGNSSQQRENGINFLIREARLFRKRVQQTGKPKVFGTWAYFINYLRYDRKIGKGERDICKRLGISQRDFVRIFNRYGKV